MRNTYHWNIENIFSIIFVIQYVQCLFYTSFISQLQRSETNALQNTDTESANSWNLKAHTFEGLNVFSLSSLAFAQLWVSFDNVYFENEK